MSFMLVSIDWLKDHISDQNIIILDTRPKTMFLYGHIQKSQSLTIEQVIQFDQYGANLVIDEKKKLLILLARLELIILKLLSLLAIPWIHQLLELHGPFSTLDMKKYVYLMQILWTCKKMGLN